MILSVPKAKKQKNAGKNHFFISIPATFLTAVCVTYLLVAPIKNGGLYLSTEIGYPVGTLVAILAMIWFILAARKKNPNKKDCQ